jgi:hypothetical protein
VQLVRVLTCSCGQEVAAWLVVEQELHCKQGAPHLLGARHMHLSHWQMWIVRAAPLQCIILHWRTADDQECLTRSWCSVACVIEDIYCALIKSGMLHNDSIGSGGQGVTKQQLDWAYHLRCAIRPVCIAVIAVIKLCFLHGSTKQRQDMYMA